MKKCFLLILILVLVFYSVSVCGETFGNLEYKRNDRSITITGCSSSIITSVTIPSLIEGLPVTSIQSDAFRYCTNLASITIPNSVTTIGDRVFDSCSSLTSVTIPDSVTSIGNGAFAACPAKRYCTINTDGSKALSKAGYPFIDPQYPSIYLYYSHYGDYITGLDVVGADANITEAVIPDGITSIDYPAFYNCSNLVSITIPNSVTYIDSYAFYNCSNLASIVIPERVTAIGAQAFGGCSNLTTVTIPDGVTSIGDYAFQDCSSLTSVTIPDGVTAIGNYAFKGCTSLKSVIIRGAITKIPQGTFQGCSSLTGIMLPSSVTEIGPEAFSGTSISNLSLNNVVTIGSGAFRNCLNLTYISLTPVISSIADDAFTGSALKDVDLPESLAVSLTSLPFKDTVTYNTYYIPSAPVDDALDAGYTVVAPMGGEIQRTDGLYTGGVMSVAYIFGYTGSATELTLPEKPENTEYYHFLTNYWHSQNATVTSITLPSTLNSVSSLSNFTALKDIYLPDTIMLNVTTLPQGYTYHAKAGTDTAVKLLAANYSFIDTETGRTIRPDSPASDFEYTINTTYNEVNITGYTGTDSVVVIPATIEGATVKAIRSRAFEGNTTITEVSVPDSVDTIYSYAFYNCSNLASVYLPADMYSIDKYAFAGTALRSIVIPEIPTLHDGVFSGCGSLTEITLPSSLQSIGDTARDTFNGCIALTDVILPDTMGIQVSALPFASTITYHANSGSSTANQLHALKKVFIDRATGELHTDTIMPAVAPTCTETGLTEGAQCAVCGYVTTTQQTVPALGHDWHDTTYTWAEDNSTVTATHFCKRDEAHIETETANVTAEVTKPANCEVAGETTYSAAFTNTAFEAQSKTLADIPATGHDWGEVTYTWADDNKSVTASRVCTHDASHTETETATVTTEVTKAATCEVAGETTYSASFTNTAFAAQSKTLDDIPATGHDWSTPTYTWAEDNKSVTASRVCRNDDSHVETETANVTATVTKPATCEVAGETTYSASFTNAAFEAQSKTLADIPATGHDWGTPTYTWTDDNKSVTASRVCSHDATHTETETATVTATVTKPATCEAAGETTYSAAFANAAFAPQSKALADIPATGHDWGDVTYTWADDNKSVTASRVCSHDGSHTETETATVTAEVTKPATCEVAGETTYSATFANTAFTAQSKTLADIPALGHDWGEVTYAWAEDNKSITASRVCSHDATHTETETATVITTVTKPATCEALGETTYSATFTNAAFEAQSKALADIPATGHDWGEVTYAWADDNQSVTASRVCKHDETHIETETATVTAEVTKPATCEVAGETTYSVAFTNTAFEAQSKTLSDIPATGHDWGEVAYTWADDNKSVTASRVCKHDASHIETETATVTATVTKTATCEVAGETTYSAAFTNAAFAAQSKTLADIPATGHDWGEVTYTWAYDNKSITASRVCRHDDSHVETETANVTTTVTKAATCEVAGETTYSASFTNEAFAAQSKTLADIPATGHDWGEVTYTWADDNKSVTASRVCKHDASLVETEMATVTATVSKAATCEAAGETTYSAAFANTAFAAQSKTLTDIPATGHDWSEVTYTWAEDNKSVTASRVCSHDATHTETETANVTTTVAKPATCEVSGETTYSAVFTNAAFTPQSKTLADIPALGHTPVFTPGKLPTAGAPGHTAGSTCSVCGKVLADHLPVESVQTLALPAALRTIADSAFARTAADHVLLPAGTTAIGPRAFADAPNLRFVTVPDSVNSIAPDAFEGCELVTFFCSDSSAAAAYAEAHGFAHTAP